MKTNSIRVVVVDDERPARRKLLRFLDSEPDILVVAEADNGQEAVEVIRRESPDVIFLDIQMPGLDGFGVIEALKLPAMPEVVFVTAYDEFALQAFQVHALDYLLKPFDSNQFQTALGRIRSHLKLKANGELSERLSHLLTELRSTPGFAERLLIDSGERAFFLPVDRIDRIESAKNYVKVHVGDRCHTLRWTMDGIFQKLNPQKFIRVNRAHIVNADFIKELHRWFHGEYKVILKDGTETTWSRRYLDRSAESFIQRF